MGKYEVNNRSNKLAAEMEKYQVNNRSNKQTAEMGKCYLVIDQTNKQMKWGNATG